MRELYKAELKKMKGGATELPVQSLLKIDVDQFYGIEIDEFPARIAETALWMMDHIMNSQASIEFGYPVIRIPLKKSPHILHGDALDVDWADHLPPKECSYIMGNPPFIGAKFQSPAQRGQVRGIANLGKSGGTLDFVCAWFIKAGEYAVGDIRIAFVSTNSITQGEQVAQLWPILFDRCKLEIAFAHRTFAWGSEARGKANVHVVIIGFDRAENARSVKRLFSYATVKSEPEETTHKALSPYMFDAGGLGNPHLVVTEISRPINGMPRLVTGTQPLEDGNLTFTNEEKTAFLTIEPNSKGLFRLFPGAREFIRNVDRWILHTEDTSPKDLRLLPHVVERLDKVRTFRSKSKRASTLRLKDFPTEYGVTVVPDKPFLVLPQVSSERRSYVPFGWLESPVIPSEKLRIIMGAKLEHFAILTSAMHMAWMRTVTGRMKSDYMYSVGVVYNTFPLPKAKNLDKLTPFAQAILDARANHVGATLADLYDPDVMPADLRRAHIANDRAVDKLYSRAGFKSERDRVEHLFALYEQQVAPMLAKPKKRR